MATTSTDRLEQQTLAWVNRARAALDADPLPEIPAGERGEARRCPIARALPIDSIAVDPRGLAIPYAQAVKAHLLRARLRSSFQYPWYVLERRICLGIPSYVRRFIVAFDQGLYPELNVRTAEGRETLRRQRMMGVQPKRR